MLLVDTSALIDFLQGADTPEARFLEKQIQHKPKEIAIPDLCLAEVLIGLRSDKAVQETLSALLDFEIVSPSGLELSIKAALNYRTLRKKGITPRTMIDCLIATCAIENDWPLLHRDRDYLPFEKHLGLKRPEGL